MRVVERQYSVKGGVGPRQRRRGTKSQVGLTGPDRRAVAANRLTEHDLGGINATGLGARSPSADSPDRDAWAEPNLKNTRIGGKLHQLNGLVRHPGIGDSQKPADEFPADATWKGELTSVRIGTCQATRLSSNDRLSTYRDSLGRKRRARTIRFSRLRRRIWHQFSAQRIKPSASALRRSGGPKIDLTPASASRPNAIIVG